ncbi:hypothetical protein Trco_003662 [Trichoderma cornu-damae]|uniref:Uncharacterized protein n=1 Tax=Trichoderma cornu-damae TaxID=654480 RepID=A0A9P8QLH0_9HYPO|nr:hypothetical protein Trco_003662 [Trichoderma cornu-damae]
MGDPDTCQVLVDSDGNLLVVHLILLDLFPLVLVGSLLGALDVQLAQLARQALDVPSVDGLFLARPQLLFAEAQRGVGAVEQRLHDGGVLAGVDAGHPDVVGEEGELLERDRLVLVVADNVLHHLDGRQGVAAGLVAGEVEARRRVEGQDLRVAGLDAEDSVVLLLVLHVRDVIVQPVQVVVADVARVVHRLDLARLERLRARQAARAEPAVVVVGGAGPALEAVAVVDDGLLVRGVAGKVVVEPAVTGHVAGDEELLAGGQVAGAQGLGVGVAPRPGRELVDEVVAGGDKLVGRDLAGAAEGRRSSGKQGM